MAFGGRRLDNVAWAASKGGSPIGLLSQCVSSAVRAYSRLALNERGGYRLARLARTFVPRCQWRATCQIPDGLHLDLDLGTYPVVCMAFGLYELDTVRVLRRLLRDGSWFVDCGANIGYFTLLAVRWMGPSGRVDAF